MRSPFLLTFILVVSLSTSLSAQERLSETYKTLGLDMELLSYGGSLGGFFNYHIRESFSIDVEADWTIVESNDTFTYLNYYNQPVSINNRNLSFVKTLVGSTWYPFLDTMHPSFQFGVFGGVGPLLSLNTADDEKFLERWQDVEPDLTLLSRAGIHFRILNGQGSAYNFRFGYDYAYFDEVIDERQGYKGLFFQAAWESIHR